MIFSLSRCVLARGVFRTEAKQGVFGILRFGVIFPCGQGPGMLFLNFPVLGHELS